jgi:uncharacterized delta-60 repeat protein
VAFGSNESATLRIGQADRGGRAMYGTADYELDTTFNPGGALPGSRTHSGSGAVGVQVQPDGKTLVMGNTYNADLLGGYVSDGQVEVRRYNVDGSLDTTFATAGLYVNELDTEPRTDCYQMVLAGDMKLQPDGKILISGAYTDVACTLFEIGNLNVARGFVIRLLPNGQVDTSFATNGTFTRRVDQMSGYFGLEVRSDGRIAASGAATDGNVLALFTPNLLDVSSVITLIEANGSHASTYWAHHGEYGRLDQVWNTLELPSGKTMFCGFSVTGVWNNANIVLGRLNANWTIDPTFGTGGLVTIDSGGGASQETCYNLRLQGSKVITAGNYFSGGQIQAALMRFNLDGSIDTTFGPSGTGRSLVDLDGTIDDAFGAIAFDDLGRILTSGSTNNNWVINTAKGTDGGRAAIARFSPDGILDTTFTPTGGVELFNDAPVGGAAGIRSILTHDGTLTVAGSTHESRGFYVRRYAPPRVPDWQPGVADWDTASSAFMMCLRDHVRSTAAPYTDTHCPTSTSDPDYAPGQWNAVPASLAPVASSAANERDARVQLRFGLRVGPAMPAGSYVAPLSFDVVAPAL